MAGEREEIKQSLEARSVVGLEPRVPAGQAGDSKTSDEARKMAARLAGVTTEFGKDAKKTIEELCKEIEALPYFIKDQDRKLTSDLSKPMFIGKSQAREGFYSLYFPFVLSSNPSCPTPICKEEWVQELDILKFSDHILLGSRGTRFKPEAGRIQGYETVIKEVDGVEESYLEPDPKLVFASLDGFINHMEKIHTADEMFKYFTYGVPDFKPELYTFTRVKDIPKNTDINRYLNDLMDSHRCTDTEPPRQPKAVAKKSGGYYVHRRHSP